MFCEILFDTVDFAHWTIAQRPEIIETEILATYHIRFCVLDMKSFKWELARTELVATGLSAFVTACSWPFQDIVNIYQLE